VKPENKDSLAELFPNLSIPDNITQDTFAEWDTWETIYAVRDALSISHNVELIEANLSAYNRLLDLRPDIVFNIAEGFRGLSREALIPAILEMLNIPFTGSDALTLSICLDKSRAKEILSYYNIPNAPFQVLYNKNVEKAFKLSFPIIVKPIGEGSGKGIFSSSFVSNMKSLQREVERINTEYNQPALCEEFLQGREFTVALLGNDSKAQILPIIEIDFSAFPNDFIPLYSYEAKWILDSKEHQLEVYSCPAKIDISLRSRIEEVAVSAYRTLRCKDWSRIDIRLDKSGVPNIIEVNPLPGILPDPKENSCFPKSAAAAGMSYNEMINNVLNAALSRYGLYEKQ